MRFRKDSPEPRSRRARSFSIGSASGVALLVIALLFSAASLGWAAGEKGEAPTTIPGQHPGQRGVVRHHDLGDEGQRVFRAYSVGREVRRFSFDYEVIVSPAIGRRGQVGRHGGARLFLPIAVDTTGQRISEVAVDSPYPGRFVDDPEFGNRYWVMELPEDRREEARVVVRYGVERSIVRAGDERGTETSARRFLSGDERVVVGHPILDPILDEIRAKTPGADRATRARAIYDWVVDNVEYKKVGKGWGNGDTFWACNERYGNCTDFHSLFISLARTEGIPARFQMGFPIPADRDEGAISGYHCWVEFWLPEQGWIPIDASEAAKHPKKRDLYYGTQPADRLQVTTGRDLRLGPEHRDRPLNYFIFPYLEIDGKRSNADLETHFRYRDRDRYRDGGGQSDGVRTRATGKGSERRPAKAAAGS